jgi:hypothetical protein
MFERNLQFATFFFVYFFFSFSPRSLQPLLLVAHCCTTAVNTGPRYNLRPENACPPRTVEQATREVVLGVLQQAEQCGASSCAAPCSTHVLVSAAIRCGPLAVRLPHNAHVANVTTWRNLTHSPFATLVAWGARTLASPPLDELTSFGKRDRRTLIRTLVGSDVEETVCAIPPPHAYVVCR